MPVVSLSLARVFFVFGFCIGFVCQRSHHCWPQMKTNKQTKIRMANWKSFNTKSKRFWSFRMLFRTIFDMMICPAKIIQNTNFAAAFCASEKEPRNRRWIVAVRFYSFRFCFFCFICASSCLTLFSVAVTYNGDNRTVWLMLEIQSGFWEIKRMCTLWFSAHWMLKHSSVCLIRKFSLNFLFFCHHFELMCDNSSDAFEFSPRLFNSAIFFWHDIFCRRINFQNLLINIQILFDAIVLFNHNLFVGIHLKMMHSTKNE